MALFYGFWDYNQLKLDENTRDKWNDKCRLINIVFKAIFGNELTCFDKHKINGTTKYSTTTIKRKLLQNRKLQICVKENKKKKQVKADFRVFFSLQELKSLTKQKHRPYHLNAAHNKFNGGLMTS